MVRSSDGPLLVHDEVRHVVVPAAAQRLDVLLLLDTQLLVVQLDPLPRFALHVRYVVPAVGRPPLVRQHRYQVVVPGHPLRLQAQTQRTTQMSVRGP
eukprot:1181313-Prorocentrum_minimum.AAC.3